MFQNDNRYLMLMFQNDNRVTINTGNSVLKISLTDLNFSLNRDAQCSGREQVARKESSERSYDQGYLWWCLYL